MDASAIAGTPEASFEALTRDALLRAYRLMLLSRRLDDKEIQLKNQSRIFFQISGAGHEAVLVAAGFVLRPSYDWFYPYYRDRALCLALGVTPYEMLLESVGASDDPASGGRQMPSHWGHSRYNIVSQSSPTATQCLQAVGCAEAALLYQRNEDVCDRERCSHPDEVTYVSLGEGATSEGEFWESLNTACAGRLPVVYLIEDNGYAISVPVEVQTPGGSISRLVESYPDLRVIQVDGSSFHDSYVAMCEAVAHARARRGPALVHARVIRPYSHSLSDDERLYKTAEERERELQRDPLPLFAEYLKQHARVEATEFGLLAEGVEAEVADAADRALRAARPARDTAALWVFSPDADPGLAAVRDRGGHHRQA